MMVTLNEDDLKKAIVQYLTGCYEEGFEFSNITFLFDDVGCKRFANVSVKKTERGCGNG